MTRLWKCILATASGLALLAGMLGVKGNDSMDRYRQEQARMRQLGVGAMIRSLYQSNILNAEYSSTLAYGDASSGWGQVELRKAPGSYALSAHRLNDIGMEPLATRLLPYDAELPTIDSVTNVVLNEWKSAGRSDIAAARMTSATWVRLRMDSAHVDSTGITFPKLFGAQLYSRVSEYGLVRIDSRPRGASIELAGKNWGKTTEEGYLPPGEVKLRLALDGYEPLDTLAVVEGRRSNEFSYKLTKSRKKQ